MAPPLLKRRKSPLLYTISKSDGSPSAQALLLPMTSVDQNVLQPQASGDQNVRHHQNAACVVVKGFPEAMVFTKTSFQLVFDNQYSMI